MITAVSSTLSDQKELFMTALRLKTFSFFIRIMLTERHSRFFLQFQLWSEFYWSRLRGLAHVVLNSFHFMSKLSLKRLGCEKKGKKIGNFRNNFESNYESMKVIAMSSVNWQHLQTLFSLDNDKMQKFHQQKKPFIYFWIFETRC